MLKCWIVKMLKCSCDDNNLECNNFFLKKVFYNTIFFTNKKTRTTLRGSCFLFYLEINFTYPIKTIVSGNE